MTQHLTTPPLYSYGVASLRNGQSISLNALDAAEVMREDWTIALRVRLRAYAMGGTLLQLLDGNLELRLGEPASSGARPDNQVKAIFHDKEVVDSEVGLTLGSWHNIVVSVARTGNSGADVIIYLDGAPFGRFEEVPVPVHVDQYHYNNRGQHPILGGGVDIECTRVTFWRGALDYTYVLESAQEVPEQASLLHAFDFTARVQDESYALTKGAEIACAIPCLEFGLGAAQVSPLDQLALGADPTQPLTLQTWVQSSPPVGEPSPRLMTLIASGAQGEADAFHFGLLYNETRSHAHLQAQLPGAAPLLDTTELQPHVGYNVALTWDGAQLTFWVDGVSTSSHALTPLPTTSARVTVIGATPSADNPSGFTQLLIGRMQSLAIWQRALSATELASFETPLPSLADGLVARFDMVNPELANAISGHRLSFQGQVNLIEALESNVAPCTARDTIPPLDADDFLFNLEELHAYEACLERLKDETPKEACPGAVTWFIQGDERVYQMHTTRGPVEILRTAASADTDCGAWRFSLIVSGVGIVLSVVGFAFSAKALGQALYKVWINNATFRQRIVALGPEILTGEGLLGLMLALYDTGALAYTIESAFSSMSWWERGYAIASAVLFFASIFATGGWAVVVLVANLQLNIAAMAYTYGMGVKAGCSLLG